MSEPTPRETGLESRHTGRLLTAAARLIEHAFDSGLTDLGVTHAGVNVLGALADGPLAQGGLAGRCRCRTRGSSTAWSAAATPCDGGTPETGAVSSSSGPRRAARSWTGPARSPQPGSATSWTFPPEERAICRGFLIKIISSLGRGCPISR